MDNQKQSINETSLANLQMFEQVGDKKTHTLIPASKNDLFSGISFSRFEAISDPS